MEGGVVMFVNQNGDEIVETRLWEYEDISNDELKEIVFVLVRKMGLTVKRTNATGSGDFELRFEREED